MVMSPIERKHALERAGYTQMRIANECGVTIQTVNTVLRGICTSYRVQCYIAEKQGQNANHV